MSDVPRHPSGARPPLLDRLGEPQLRVALVTALALIVQAVLAKNVFDVELDFFSQFAALWVFIAFMVSDRRDRLAEAGAIAAIVAVTVGVLTLYAI